MPPSTPRLSLSLQFARDPLVREHRALLPRAQVARWLKAALQGAASLNVRIVGEAEGRALNHSYRGKDYATNVLTFEYGAPAVSSPLGAGIAMLEADIVLCAPVVAAEATAQGKALQAHYAHLLVHGALHAQGFDHERARDAKVMEALEVQVLRGLGFANPYSVGTQP
jgi:probable rRNA maturation factor